MMFLRSLALLSLLLLTLGAQAEERRPKPGVVAEPDAQQLEQARRQKRRDVVREALLVPVADAPVALRQLSPQEKAELRQQLQQQPREWLNK
jgi:hypothetical protein